MTVPSLADLVADYLAVRRGLGFQLAKPGVLLADFARYADRVGHHGPLTNLRWHGRCRRARATRHAPRGA